VNFTDLLYVIDNDGNEHELSSCLIVKNSKIFTKNVKSNIELGFKIIKKNNGICDQIFIVNEILEILEDLRYLEVQEF